MSWHILAAIVAAHLSPSGASAADLAAARAVAATLAASGDAVALNYIATGASDDEFIRSADRACRIRGM